MSLKQQLEQHAALNRKQHAAREKTTEWKGGSLWGANLSFADLRGINLRGANLRDANLCGADLRDANLRDANLRDANLCGAYLRDANLRGANLGFAYLGDADLRGASLSFANLSFAYLGDARGVVELPVGGPRGYRVLMVLQGGEWRFFGGCRGPWTVAEARGHFGPDYDGDRLSADRVLEALDWWERTDGLAERCRNAAHGVDEPEGAK